MNMYILFLMFVLCYFCNIDMYIFDKINVLYLLYFTLLEESIREQRDEDQQTKNPIYIL